MKKLSAVVAIFLFFLTGTSYGENSEAERPAVTMGITATGGFFDYYSRNINSESKPGLYTGGGIIIEKSVSPHFALGSGFQYRYFSTTITLDDSGTEYEADWTFQSINIPFTIILSTGGDYSLNFHIGAVYSNIFYSRMKTDTTLALEKYEDNVMRFTRVNQIGATAGLSFRMRVGEFTDLTLGVFGEGYPTNLLYNTDSSIYTYSFSVTAGCLFRTYLLPSD